LIDLYDAEIRYNDEYIGKFLDELRNRGILEKSLLIVTADHGDAFGEHGYYEHPRYLHDEITHVPLFVRIPSGNSNSVESPVSTLDIVATIEEVTGRDNSESTSLFSVSDDKRVFSQARGENDYSHLRRYAARSEDNVAFCERDTEHGTVEFTEWSGNQGLRNELEVHVEERTAVENGDTIVDSNGITDESEVNEDIERRLEALGYKE